MNMLLKLLLVIGQDTLLNIVWYATLHSRTHEPKKLTESVELKQSEPV